MIGPYKYKATIYDGINGSRPEVFGVTFADTYYEAMKNIEAYYGEDIITVSLYALEEATVYEFDPKNINKLIE